MQTNNMKNAKLVTWGIFAAATLVLVGLDLLLKSWASANMLGADSRVLVPGLLGLTYTRNTGAAFGLLGGFDWGRWALVVVKVVLISGLFWFYARLPHVRRAWFARVPVILIIAGGLGNLIDRVFMGSVRDMLEFLFVNFPIFNLADIFVVVGCVLGVIVVFAEDYP